VLHPHDIAEFLRLSRSATYRLLNSQAFRVRRAGRMLLTDREVFLAWLRQP